MKKKRLHKIKETAKRPIDKLRGKEPDPIEKAKVPYITNETIAEHREEVLSGARKYIYPLQHSKRKIVLWSSIIFSVTVVFFIAYSLFGLYRSQDTSTFMYRVTQIVPFPVARMEGKFVSYENYLFELRHYMHYYETQQKLSFDTEEGQEQLKEFKHQAMQTVIDDAYIKHLAEANGVEVTNKEVDQEIAIVREQNRLGTSDQVFEDVLRDFWGWSVNDFKRSLRQQLLTRKVVSKLDSDAHARAQAALNELKAGADFAEVAKKYSDDEGTREAGGDYGLAIDKSNRDIPAKMTSKLFSLQPGQYSEIIDTGYTLEIVKLTGMEGDKAKAAHIQIVLRDINDLLEPLKAEKPTKQYLNL